MGKFTTLGYIYIQADYLPYQSITSGLTQRLIFSAMGGFDAPDRGMKPFPYLTFDPNSNQGAAIMGMSLE